MSRLHVHRDGAFRRDARLRAAIAEIVAASFIDEAGRLDRELERRDTLYTLEDAQGDLTSFFMVSWDTLEIDGRERPTLNVGLTAARPEQKGTGSSIRLYRHVVAEAQERERRGQEKRIVWGTMASPIAFLIARRIFANFQPSLDGTYLETAEQVARAIGRKLGVPQANGANPFLFPGLVAGVRFTQTEQHRLKAVCRERDFTLFERLGIDETKGDRLLFIADVPPPR